MSTGQAYRSSVVSTQEVVSHRNSPAFAGFNNDIVKKLDWDEAHFEEAKALINKYLQVSRYHLRSTCSNLTVPISGSSRSSSRNRFLRCFPEVHRQQAKRVSIPDRLLGFRIRHARGE